MPLTHMPATLLRRIAAATYDGMLMIALWMAATFPLLTINNGEAISAGALWYPLYLASITGAFHIWFWTHGGQTLGMRAWRLWAVNQNGENLSTLHATRRYLVAVVSWFSLIGIVWCLFESRGRAAHDLISQSDIIHIPKNASR